MSREKFTFREILKTGIGERIKSFGVKTFGGLGALASEVGLSAQQISNYVAERNLPGTPFLLKLAEHGCDIHWLLTGEDRVASSLILRERVGFYNARNKEVMDQVRKIEHEIKILREKLESE